VEPLNRAIVKSVRSSTGQPFNGATSPAVFRDLQIICLKCLEKEPTRRYISAQALADELERWLRDEPILARPATSVEKFRRWCKRRRGLGALSGGLAVVLLAGVLGVTWEWRRAQNNASDARREAERARRAESEKTERLWLSLVEQARANRRMGEAGQRHRALE